MEINKCNYGIDLKKCMVQDEFWTPFQELIKNVVIPYQKAILEDKIEGVEKSGAIQNFRIAAGLAEGDFYGMVFQDSDVAKWLETVAYSLEREPNPELEAYADEIIEIIGKAQQSDGYLNTYFTIKEPNHRWQNLQECHELYCAGHMIEAAVAYYEATGKKSLLSIMQRMADHIYNRFGPDKYRGIPGHQEIELALLKLYRVTGESRYRDLAGYFINERGTEPNFFSEESDKRQWKHFNLDPEDRLYSQNHAPVREQKTAEGHCVRAMYMYTAMADYASETGDKTITDACRTLWNNIVNKRMFITGGIGSTSEGEAFSIDYDLPNDMAYNETCASIGLVFFARKMLDMEPDSKYADVMEKALYNGVLSGIQLDGKRFFYVNPLEVIPGISGKLFGFKHVLPVRQGWYACACCPPNVARLLTSLQRYIWGTTNETIFAHLFVGGTSRFGIGGGVEIETITKFPWEGSVKYVIKPDQESSKFTLAIRLPGWSTQTKVTQNGEYVDIEAIDKNGYLYFEREWKFGDTIELMLDMRIRRIYANTAVRSDANCTALMRGPIVYCIEQADNGPLLSAIRLPRTSEITYKIFENGKLTGMTYLEAEGIRLSSKDDSLYSEEPPVPKPHKNSSYTILCLGKP